MKIVDFDKLFDEFVKSFLQRIKGKYTAEKIEDAQPELFKRFANKKIANLGNITPVEYYENNKDVLIDVLKEHIRQDVSVNEFLHNALCKHLTDQQILQYLNPNLDGAFVFQILLVLDKRNSVFAFNRLIDLLFDKQTEDFVVDKLIETLCENPAEFCRLALADARATNFQAYACEIICCLPQPQADATKFLTEALLANLNDLPMFLSYVTKYGDESMLSLLVELSGSELISYVDYKELVIAIESLGGSVGVERDFSFDETYKLLKGENGDKNVF